MSLGIATDVAIGIIFIYLLLGLLSSAIQEFGAGFLNLRGKALLGSLEKLLDTSAPMGSAASLFKGVTGHPLLRGASATRPPSYVAPYNFALATVETLRSAGSATAPIFTQIETGIQALPAGPAKQCLQAIAVEASGDIDVFKRRVSLWFDDAMDRASGTYKRYSHLFGFALGLTIAVLCNVDTIAIGKTLWTDPHARDVLVASAQQYVLAHPDLTPNEVTDQIKTLPVPIGWPDGFWKGVGIWSFVGWFITGCATALGAPFWFDTLQRILNLRATGPKPERTAPDAASAAPSS